MSAREIKNAIIKSASLSIEDHDCLTVWIHLDFGGTGQGFGGHALMLGPSFKHRKDCEKGPNYTGVYIDTILRIADVSSWDKLPGKTIRVDSDHGKVYGIGHIIKDNWFYPEQVLSALNEEGEAP
ncbi:MAG TPA: hypothetical protein VFE62_01395 [Gemmataceae bacterium]|nr:hypothetical protein [Gemmataceae bacterium]